MAQFLVTNTAFMIFDSFMYIFDMSLEANQKAEPLLTNMTFVFFCHFRHFVDSNALQNENNPRNNPTNSLLYFNGSS